jgi:hypothetical protein
MGTEAGNDAGVTVTETSVAAGKPKIAPFPPPQPVTKPINIK